MTYIHDDFLLESREARKLYHGFGEGLPIVDYHCHLPPSDIAQDKRWENIAQVWLGGDHYKWRVMRANAVPERFCTGDAPDREKFQKWAETMPYILRNPLYPWAHLELARYFGVSDLLLGPDTAEEIWQRANARLAEPDFSARGLIRQSNVAVICTTDDPVDSLEHHRAIAADDDFDTPVLPTWRPDRGMAVDDPKAFNAWVNRLEKAADMEIADFTTYIEALRTRHEAFHEAGCRLSDHGVETVCGDDFTERQLEEGFLRIRGGEPLEPDAIRRFKSGMLHIFAVMDHERDWTQQIHYGAIRNNNSRMFERLGPDTGFDSMGDFEIARPLSRFLDRLDRDDQLPRTILYNLNPRDNALLVTMAGNFPDESVPGKVQHGSGWWFLDQEDGIRRQLESLSQMGCLGRFVGMLTDSRSFLSYTRHEYFRRVLCNLLGGDIARGALPHDLELAGRMVRDISYNNAARYFGFDLPVVEK
mgnify:CR=1 FL=1